MPAASGNNSSNSSSPKVGRAKLGRPFGIVAGDGNAERRQAECRCDNDRQDDDRKSDRPARQQALAQQEQQDRHKPDRQHDPVDAAELSDKRDQAIEEIASAAGNAEQARQLRHDDGQARACLEADQNAVADQAHQHAEPENPGDQAEHGNGQRRQARDLRIADRVAAGERADRARRSSARSPRSVRPRAAATSRAARSRCRRAYSRRRRPAAATRQARHRPATPGSRRRRA